MPTLAINERATDGVPHANGRSKKATRGEFSAVGFIVLVEVRTTRAVVAELFTGLMTPFDLLFVRSARDSGSLLCRNFSWKSGPVAQNGSVVRFEFGHFVVLS
ncbi:hypothetical protein Nepgr_011067 [Nepenthes gracilis]|uniref:Uncharacterized protein n=1 Tax=Nepenthes gracilis TaxID=150966 RepID=A0AAD3SEL8_NEPGR|nr:hypothetical protein Nepgr_011067 [Nepenthes gracilis]